MPPRSIGTLADKGFFPPFSPQAAEAPATADHCPPSLLPSLAAAAPTAVARVVARRSLGRKGKVKGADLYRRTHTRLNGDGRKARFFLPLAVRAAGSLQREPR